MCGALSYLQEDCAQFLNFTGANSHCGTTKHSVIKTLKQDGRCVTSAPETVRRVVVSSVIQLPSAAHTEGFKCAQRADALTDRLRLNL